MSDHPTSEGPHAARCHRYCWRAQIQSSAQAAARQRRGRVWHAARASDGAAHIQTRTRTHAHARTHARTHACTHTRMHARTHACMHACKNAHTNACMRTCAHACACRRAMPCVCTYLLLFVRAYWSVFISRCVWAPPHGRARGAGWGGRSTWWGLVSISKEACEGDYCPRWQVCDWSEESSIAQQRLLKLIQKVLRPATSMHAHTSTRIRAYAQVHERTYTCIHS